MSRSCPRQLLAFCALLSTLAFLPGCPPGAERGGFYTRTWYEEHLLLVDRDPERTHFVSFETNPPGFHYSADATVTPPTALVIHTPSGSVRAFDVTPAMLKRWQREYFTATECTHTVSNDQSSEGYFLRTSAGKGVARFLTCFFRKRDGQLKSLEYRIDPRSVDLDGEFDTGPFSFSLGTGKRMVLPIRIGDAQEIIGRAGLSAGSKAR